MSDTLQTSKNSICNTSKSHNTNIHLHKSLRQCVCVCVCARTRAHIQLGRDKCVHVCIDKACDVISPCFVPTDTSASGRTAHTIGTHAQVRIVIAMMTGRKKIEQDVLAVLFGEEGRAGAVRGKGGGGGDQGDWEWRWLWTFWGFLAEWDAILSSANPFPEESLSWWAVETTLLRAHGALRSKWAESAQRQESRKKEKNNTQADWHFLCWPCIFFLFN